jgi:hypothetical protein
MANHRKKHFYLIIIMWLLLFAAPCMAENPKPGVIYDIQCGCFGDSTNAARFAYHLQELELPWYCVPSDPCTRFIVDANVDWLGISYFINNHVEFMDAFLVPNYGDLPLFKFKNAQPVPTKENFIRVMAPYMQAQYIKGYYNPNRLPMKDEQAQSYTQTIYEAAEYYKLDPFLLFALGNFESYFSNILGDLNRLNRKVPDPAQGMFQILKSTARIIYDDMKNQNLPHTPETFPSDLRKHPRSQIYFAAHYLHTLHEEYHDNQYMALLYYNANSKPNFNYPRKVMRFYQRATNYYFKSIELPKEKTPFVMEAATHTRERNRSNRILSQ